MKRVHYILFCISLSFFVTNNYQMLKLEKATLEAPRLQSPPQPVMPSSQPMSIPPPPQREATKTMSLKAGANRPMYPPSLQASKLAVRPSCSNQTLMDPEFWKWETTKGRLVLIVQRSSGHIRLLLAQKALV